MLDVDTHKEAGKFRRREVLLRKRAHRVLQGRPPRCLLAYGLFLPPHPLPFGLKEAKAPSQELEIAPQPCPLPYLTLRTDTQSASPFLAYETENGRGLGTSPISFLSAAADHSADGSDPTLGSYADKPQGAGMTVYTLPSKVISATYSPGEGNKKEERGKSEYLRHFPGDTIRASWQSFVFSSVVILSSK